MSKKMMDTAEGSENSMDDKQAYFLSKEATNMESSIVFEVDREFAISVNLDISPHTVWTAGGETSVAREEMRQKAAGKTSGRRGSQKMVTQLISPGPGIGYKVVPR